MFIMFAYGVASYQISGAPNWVGLERWDIEAKTDNEAKTHVEGRLPLAQSQALLRRLLEDRFQLKTLRENRKNAGLRSQGYKEWTENEPPRR
jgi:uncharacterized protein (TIGR03435 family)